MNSIRKWLYRPKREDPSKLVQFYYADEELNIVATELDSFDGHKDPDRCSALVNQLRLCQDKVLNICNEIMDEAIPTLRANRDYRVKFPDEMLHENLAGQLWFGAECLAAGSNVANREEDSEEIRPLAKAVTKALDDVRNLLRDHCLRNSQIYSDKLKEALEIFDRLFAEFELRYVRIMVPIKTLKECHLQQEIIVLFSETLQRALRINLVSQDMIDDCDPSLMFTVPRLAIVCGLIIYSDGPLNLDNGCSQMSYMFKPFYHTLNEIRELLWTLSNAELGLLERTLCSMNDFQIIQTNAVASDYPGNKFQNYVNLFLQSHQSCQQFISDFYGCHVNNSQSNQNLAASNSITETWQTEDDDKEKIINYFLRNSNMIDSNDDIPHSTITFDCSDGEQNLVTSNIPNYSDDITLTATSNDAQYVFEECCSENKSDFSKIDEVSNYNTRTDSDMEDKMHNKENYFSTENRCTTWCTSDYPCNETDTHFNDHKDISSNERNNKCSELHSTLNTSSYSKKVSSYVDKNTNSIKNKCENCKNSNVNCNHEQITRQENNPSSSKITETHVSSQTDNSSDILHKFQTETEDMYNVLGYIEDEAIALALQTAEIASHNEVRSNYNSSEELIHKLFVAISEVADQLQTNCASDLRSILKSVFDMNSSHSSMLKNTSVNEDVSGEIQSNNEEIREVQKTEEIPEASAISISTLEEDRTSIDSAEEAVPGLILQENINLYTNLQNRQIVNSSEVEPPHWVPDEVADSCMACNSHFTLLRRRHHCRNCGKIFCSRCSSYSTALPHYGLLKPVRVCHQCFVHQVTSYMVVQRCSPTSPPF